MNTRRGSYGCAIVSFVSDLNPSGMPSGLIEIFSKMIARFGYANCPGHPVLWNRSNVAIARQKQNIRYICNPAILINDFIRNFAPATSFVKRIPSEEESSFMCVPDASGRGLKAGEIGQQGSVSSDAILFFTALLYMICVGHCFSWRAVNSGMRGGVMCLLW